MFCEATVEQGALQGKIVEAYDGRKYYSFEGIPYAEPPVGDLRFKNPEPLDSWPGLKDCTKPGNRCAQINPLSGKGFEGSEDCLYLNVYTPSLPAKKIENLPVLFFIHGGKLILGYGDYYQPDYFLRHDVILVTVNYRLNVLGFLCLDMPEAPGNVGMKDCAVALRWVKRNISNFNGDPNNITVFGESAGAAIGSSFLCSQMTIGLFSKIILQSANHIADIFMHVQDNVNAGRQIASVLGKELDDKKSIYDFLKNTPVEDLVEAYISTEMARHPYDISPICMPVIEKEFEGVERMLTELPKDSMRNNNFQKVPILMGSQEYEAAVFIRQDDDGIFYEKDLKFTVPQCLYLKETDSEFRKITNAVKQFYFQDKEIGDSTREQYVLMMSDALFNREIIYFAELASKYNDRGVFVYEFNYEGNLNFDVMKNMEIKGTTHGDLIQYQFYRKSKHKRCTERDMKLIDLLSETWCNFAKHGKPTWSNQPVEWLSYTPKHRHTLSIDENIKLVENKTYARCKFWIDICERKANL
uniref:Carboxyl/choline esterase n=1 Tax=Chilo suppressalis TaxID=168631 RepID=A0A0B4RXW5_CHISP|nr:carboxyl/choline esterase [Chilo suppressalis]